MNGKVRFDFSGRVVLVSGAARGVGRELVRQFLKAGALVAAVDREKQGLEKTCRQNGPNCQAFVVDIQNQQEVQGLMQTIEEKFGELDVCVNNAAVAPHTALLEESVKVWDRVYAVNCRGTFLMTQAAARLMVKGGKGGRIINFSSAVSKRGSAGSAAYASSRAAVESFSRTAAIELAPYNILVNTISPGLIDTQPKPLPPSMKISLENRIPSLPLARPGTADEVAQVVLFLASEAASYISGEVIMVDGASSIGSRPNGQVIDEDVRYDWVTGRERGESEVENE